MIPLKSESVFIPIENPGKKSLDKSFFLAFNTLQFSSPLAGALSIQQKVSALGFR